MLLKALTLPILLLIFLSTNSRAGELIIIQTWYSFAVSTNGNSHSAISFSRRVAEKEALLGCVKKEMKPCTVRSHDEPKAFMAYVCWHYDYYVYYFYKIGDMEETIRYSSEQYFRRLENRCELAAHWDPLKPSE